VLKRTFPIIILLLLSCEVDKNNKPKPVESVSSLSSPIPISTPIVTPSVPPIGSPSNLQHFPTLLLGIVLLKVLMTMINIFMNSESQMISDYSVGLQGSIYDNKNQPIKDAVILLENERSFDSFKNPKVSCSTYKINFETKTDEKGYYNFEKISSGLYFITVSKKGMTAKSLTLTIFGDSSYPGPCFDRKDLITFFSLTPTTKTPCGYGNDDLLLKTEPEVSELIINGNKIDSSFFYTVFQNQVFLIIMK
jgi:hypothetical protein